jgi:RNA polymerase sigma-70 factor (ECF subfamily)
MEQPRPSPASAAPDDEFVARTLAGEREAFGELWDRHYLRVYDYGFRHLGDREQAEDATAETFRRALAKLGSYRGNGFRPWLFAIAHNVIVDELRARRPIVDLYNVADQCDDGPAFDDLVLAGAEIDLVTNLLPRLTPGQRDVIELRLADLTLLEIAQVLGKARSAVDMTYRRALEQLRTLLGIADGVPGGCRDE